MSDDLSEPGSFEERVKSFRISDESLYKSLNRNFHFRGQIPEKVTLFDSELDESEPQLFLESLNISYMPKLLERDMTSCIFEDLGEASYWPKGCVGAETDDNLAEFIVKNREEPDLFGDENDRQIQQECKLNVAYDCFYLAAMKSEYLHFAIKDLLSEKDENLMCALDGDDDYMTDNFCVSMSGEDFKNVWEDALACKTTREILEVARNAVDRGLVKVEGLKEVNQDSNNLEQENELCKGKGRGR